MECLEDFIRIKENNYEYYKDAIQSMENFELLTFNPKVRNNPVVLFPVFEKQPIGPEYRYEAPKGKGY